MLLRFFLFGIVLLWLFLACGMVALAQSPTPGSVGVTVKKTGAGSETRWIPPDAGKVLGFNSMGELTTLTGGSGGGGGAWGTISGSLANQTDLKAALDGKLGVAETTEFSRRLLSYGDDYSVKYELGLHSSSDVTFGSLILWQGLALGFYGTNLVTRAEPGEGHVVYFPTRSGTVFLVENEDGRASLTTDITGTLSVGNGGTGSHTAAGARTNLGLTIGTNVLAPNGNGSALTSLNAGALTTGTVAPARLGSGTASGATFLRGDGTWASPPSGGGGGATTMEGLTGTSLTFDANAGVGLSLANAGGALKIESPATTNGAGFRLVPYLDDVFFQNLYSGGGMVFSGSHGADLTGTVQVKSSGLFRVGASSPRLDVTTDGSLYALHSGSAVHRLRGEVFIGVDAEGNGQKAALGSYGLYLDNGTSLNFGMRTSLQSINPNNLDVMNGTSAQSLRLYETYTDPLNYERLTISAGSGLYAVKPEAFGTGVASQVEYHTTASGVRLTSGVGSPESAVSAPVGSVYQRSDGAAGSSLYVKESGAGNTGWQAVGAGGSGGGGDVGGPVSATDNALVRWDGASGKLIQSSSATLSDTGWLHINGAFFDSLISGETVQAMNQVSLGGDGHLLRTAGGEFNIVLFPDKGGTTRYVPLVTNTSGLVSLSSEVTGNLSISQGGTGATAAGDARTNLGLAIGTDVLAPNGSGASLTGLNASALSSGTVPTARLGSGTADGTTFLRGDGTWAAAGGGGGGGMANFEESFSSTNPNHLLNSARLGVIAGGANASFVIGTKGNGSFILGAMPDGTALGGNARGNNSIDLQHTRGNAVQVASGNQSVAIGNTNRASGGQSICVGISNEATGTLAPTAIGQSNTASGASSLAIGRSNIASGQESIAIGRQNTASGVGAVAMGSLNSAGGNYSVAHGTYASALRYGATAYSSGRFSITGDAQSGKMVLRNVTVNSDVTELFSDGVSGINKFTTTSGKVVGFTLTVIGSTQSATSTPVMFMRKGLIRHQGSTVSVETLETIGSDYGAPGFELRVNADNGTAKGLKIEVISSPDETWRWVASLDYTELVQGN